MKSPQQRWRDGLSEEKRQEVLQKQRERMRRARGTTEVSEHVIAFRSTPRLVDLVERQPEWWPIVHQVFNGRVMRGKLPRVQWLRYIDSTSPHVTAYFLELYRMVFRSFTWLKLVETIEANPKLQHPLLLQLRDDYLRSCAGKPQLNTPPNIESYIADLHKGSLK